MTRLFNRRLALISLAVLIGGSSMAETATGPAGTISGRISFADGEAIPKGQIVIFLEQPDDPSTAVRSETDISVTSDGKSTAIPFSLPTNATTAGSSLTMVVALLEREDGWLLARGSTKINPGNPTDVTLYDVIH